MLASMLRDRPDDIGLWRTQLRLAVSAGRMDDALVASRRVTEIDATDAVAWAQLGSLEQLVGRLDRAEKALRRAVELLPDAAHLIKLANVMRQLGRAQEALSLLRQASQLKPELAAAWQSRAEVALDLQLYSEAEDALRKALLVAPERPASRYQLGLALQGQDRLEEACDQFDLAYAQDRHHYGALANALQLRLRLSRWDGLGSLLGALRDAISTGIPGLPVDLPGLDRDDPGLQRQAGEQQAEQLLRALRRDYPDGIARPSRTLPEQPRVALLWIGQAARAFRRQLAGLLAQLDPGQAGWLLYTDQATAAELLNADLPGCGARFDITGWDHHRLAHQLIDQGVDLLIDAGGWTEGALSAALALRPAALQLAWLGHGGSSGAPWIDYLIGDPGVLIAPERDYYSEHWLQLPHCHLPADRTPVLSQLASRVSVGLPAGGFLFMNLGGREKLHPDLWQAWLEILREVPDSTLCLYSTPALVAADSRLRETLTRAGLDAERLCFLNWNDDNERLQLLRHADLYLDTWPSGARASGADALWAGLPVISRVGRSLGARIAGSQLRSLGMDELLADSRERYIDLAILIARSPDLLAELRGKLAARKASSPLFDQARFGADFCRGLSLAWARHRAGLAPADIVVGGQGEGID